MEQAIYKLLTLNRNAAISVYNLLLKVKGLKCTIWLPGFENQPVQQYEPGEQRSIFGLEGLVDYENYPSTCKVLLLFNIFQNGYIGTNEFDTFKTDTYCLTLFNDYLPLQTLIKVNLYGKYMYFKVDDHQGLTPSVCDQLFIKNILVPAT